MVVTMVGRGAIYWMTTSFLPSRISKRPEGASSPSSHPVVGDGDLPSTGKDDGRERSIAIAIHEVGDVPTFER